MKKYTVLLLILCFSFLVVGCSPKKEQKDSLSEILTRKKMIVGVKYDAKPFGFLNSHGQPEGFDVDFSKRLARNILGDESKVEFVQVTSANRIFMLNSRKVDMVIATMSVTPARLEVVDFSVPYYISGQSILVPQKSDVKSISDLNGKSVIVVFGSTAEKNLRMMAPDAKIFGYKTYTKAYDALKNGAADAMSSDDTILLGLAMNDPTLKLLPKKYSVEPYAVAFVKGEGSVSLRSKVDNIIRDMERTGELNQLRHKWTHH